MVLIVSLGAALLLLATFFGVATALRRSGVPRPVGAVVAGVAGGVAWFVAVAIGRSSGAVTTDEAQFHHLYVLLVVGLPLAGTALAVATWRRPPSERVVRVRQWCMAAALVIPAAIGVWATHIEPTWLRIDRQLVDVGADATEHPITIGVIADIQTDVFGGYEDSVVDEMLAEQPDLIVVAGDNTQLLWDDYLGIRGDLVSLLARLEAPHGVFVIGGNTDPGPLEVAAVVTESGHEALLDEVVEIEVRGQRIRIGGLSWPNNGRPTARQFVRGFAATSTPDTVDVLLAHSPDAVLNLRDASAIDLVVSGHTHGGQIALPFIGPLWNVTDLPGSIAGGGVHDVRGAATYVSTGVGVQRGESPKVRFGVRPSIGVLTLD